jgi:hypothetical protein
VAAQQHGARGLALHQHALAQRTVLTALQQSIEFTPICPESATAMRKSL